MKIYIGIKYEADTVAIIAGIKTAIKNLGHEPYCFIEEGKFTTEKEMMENALKAIDESDAVLLDCSRIGFGIGIEGGYAYAKNKKIIAIASIGIPFSRTIQGISVAAINYEDFIDLENQLRKIM
jgi:nucleoside 2-deoxyribosyltransferase